MTTGTVFPEADRLRCGLSTADEMRLLVLLRFANNAVERFRERSPWPQSIPFIQPSQWGDCLSALRMDLVDKPLVPQLHTEWIDAIGRQMPAALRKAWLKQDKRALKNPFLAAQLPNVSGRLRRALHNTPDLELSCLAAFSFDAQTHVVSDASERALAVLLSRLSERKRLGFLAVLGADVGKRIQVRDGTLWQQMDARCEEALFDCLKMVVSRASKSAHHSFHLMSRVRCRLLSIALPSRYDAEAEAIALAWSVRDGRRLQRNRRRDRDKWGQVTGVIQSLFLSCMNDHRDRKQLMRGSEQ